MKRKTIHMILLPLVGVIWLTVIVRIFWQEGPSQPTSAKGGPALAFASESAAPDNLRLSLAYEDPFFQQARPARRGGPERIALASPQPASRKAPEAAPAPPPPVNWDFIQYKGLAQVSHSTHITALLQVGGRSAFLKAGQTFEEVVLLAVFADSVRVRFRDEERVIRRK